MGKVITSITLSGREISIERQMLSLNSLQFYADNPRIYTLVHASDDEEPDQDQIQLALEKMDHVKQLIQAIRENGGLTDPLLVRGSDKAVIEGNSRLAAYHVLARRDAIEWSKVKCDVITGKINNQDVTTLLSSYHIIGRKSWDPFEQAGMFWRWHKEGTALEEILKRVEGMGISSKMVRHWIEVYSFMIHHHDTAPNKWSYYDELLKNRDVKKIIEENPKFTRTVVKQIKTGEIERAVDVRSKVTKIAKARGRALKNYVEDGKSLDKCFEVAVAGGATNVLYNKIHKFREVIGAPETRAEFKHISSKIGEKCRFELERIQKYIKRLLKQL